MRTAMATLLAVALVFPGGVEAATVVDYAQSAGLVMAQQPPQASAEALLKLPSVYVLPGSLAYWFKQVVEDVRLFFAAKPEDRASLLLSMSQDRLAEGYQAVKDGQWQAAVTSLQRFQQEQQSLSSSLDSLNSQNGQWKPLITRLNQQLQIQQALEQYVHSHSTGLGAKDEQRSEQVGQLLGNSAFNHLAEAVFPQRAVLGAEDHQASSSARATASAQASSSASPATAGGGGNR